MKNVEIGVVWEIRGQPQSTAMLPFDTAHTTSYSTSIEIISYLSKVAYFNLPHLHFVPPLGDPNWISLRHLAPELESLGYHIEILHAFKFSHFDTIPACDGHTNIDTQTHNDGKYLASIVSHAKNHPLDLKYLKFNKQMLSLRFYLLSAFISSLTSMISARKRCATSRTFLP